MIAVALGTAVAVLGYASSTSDAPTAVQPSTAFSAGATGTPVAEHLSVVPEAVHLIACEDQKDMAASCINFDRGAWLIYVNASDVTGQPVEPCSNDTQALCVKPTANTDGTFTLYLS